MFAEKGHRRRLKRKINEPDRRALGARFDQRANQLEFFESQLLLDKAETVRYRHS